MKWLKLLAICILVLAVIASLAAADYKIDWSVLDSGGGHHLGGGYALDDSIGQAAVGVSSSDSYTVQAGFLYGIPYRIKSDGADSGGPLVVQGWNLVSFPACAEDGTAANVLAGVDVANASLQYWTNGVPTEKYQLYGTIWGWPETTPVQVGVPYWFYHSGSELNLDFWGYPLSGPQTKVFPATATAPHWVMFGHMQDHATSCDGIQFSTTSHPGLMTWVQAYDGGYLESAASMWDSRAQGFITAASSAYASTTHSFSPWRGYWILLRTSDVVNMNMPY